MSTPVTANAVVLPENTCFPPDFQSLLDSIAANLILALSDTVTLFNFGPNKPPDDQEDQPWIRTDANGVFLGIYTFNGNDNNWEPAAPPFITGDVMPVGLATQAINPPWYVMNGQTVNGIVVPDWRGVSPIGAGQRVLPAGSTDTATNFQFGQTGGEERHVLVTAEMPMHSHAPNGTGKFVIIGTSGNDVPGGSGAGRLDTVTSEQGSDEGHNNLHPYFACNWKIYISAVDAGLS